MPRARRCKRGNGEGSIFKRSNGRWVSSITAGFDSRGLQDRKDYYGKTRAEVVKKLDDARKHLEEGRPLSPAVETA